MEDIFEYILITNWKEMVMIVPIIILVFEVVFRIIDKKYNTHFIYISKFVKLLIIVIFAVYTYLDAVQIEILSNTILRLSRRVTSLAIIMAWNAVFEEVIKIGFEEWGNWDKKHT